MSKRAGDSALESEFGRTLKRLKAEAGVDHFSDLPSDMRIYEITKYLSISDLRAYSMQNEVTRREAMDIFRGICAHVFRSPITGQPLALYTKALQFVDGSFGHTFADLYLYCNQKSRIAAALMLRRMFTQSYPGNPTPNRHLANPVQSSYYAFDPRGEGLPSPYNYYHVRWTAPLAATAASATYGRIRTHPELRFTWSHVPVGNGGLRLVFQNMGPFHVNSIPLVPAASNALFTQTRQRRGIRTITDGKLVGWMETMSSAVLDGYPDNSHCTCFLKLCIMALDIDLMQAALQGTDFAGVATANDAAYENGNSIATQLLTALPRQYTDSSGPMDDFGHGTFRPIVDAVTGHPVVFE